MLFGCCFLKRSFVLTSNDFQQVDATHWVLDLRQLVGQNFHEVRDVCLFLPNGSVVDGNSALSLYVQAGGSPWEYRGCVCLPRPSEVFPLQWPEGSSNPNSPAQIGISIEPLAEVSHREEQVAGSKEEFAKRVAMDLFRYMESFQDASSGHRVGVSGDNLVVPANCLDKWFSKFQAKFRRDPEFLTRQQNAA